MHISQSSASLLTESSCRPNASLIRTFHPLFPWKTLQFPGAHSSLCLKGVCSATRAGMVGSYPQKHFKAAALMVFILILTIMPKCLRQSWPQHVNSLGNIVSYSTLRELEAQNVVCARVCSHVCMSAQAYVCLCVLGSKDNFGCWTSKVIHLFIAIYSLTGSVTSLEFIKAR